MIHTDIKLAMRDIGLVLDDLNQFLEEDEQLKLDMLEGETDLFSIARRLLNDCEEDEGNISALDEQIDARKARKDRAKLRIERRKAAIGRLMDCARLTKLPLPEATVSLRTLKPRPKVTELDELPSEYVTEVVTLKADMDAIADAMERGESIPGVVMTNGGASLTVRRK